MYANKAEALTDETENEKKDEPKPYTESDSTDQMIQKLVVQKLDEQIAKLNDDIHKLDQNKNMDKEDHIQKLEDEILNKVDKDTKAIVKETIENHTGEKDEEKPEKKKKVNLIKAHNIKNLDSSSDKSDDSFDENVKDDEHLKELEKKMKELDETAKKQGSNKKKDNTFDSSEHAGNVKTIVPKKSKKVEKEALNLAENLFNEKEKTISLNDLKKEEAALTQDDNASALVLQKAIEDAFEVKP